MAEILIFSDILVSYLHTIFFLLFVIFIAQFYTICKKYSRPYQFSEMSFKPLMFTLFVFEVPVFSSRPHLISDLILLNVNLSMALPKQSLHQIYMWCMQCHLVAD